MTQRSFLQNPTLLAALTGICTMVVYLFTLAPGLTFIDAGELASVAYLLGVAHPTGYPLFTLVGRVFSMLPIGQPIFRLNLMAALLCSAGVAVFVRMMFFLLVRAGNTRRPSLVAALTASAGAGLLLAFSETYWSQATSVEVYSLHCLFLAAVVFSFLASFEHEHSPLWILFAFLLGLSFTNHMTTILLGPAFLYYYFAQQGFGAAAWKRIGLMIGPFLLGLTPYFYLPIRASMRPLLNWGNPVSLERFLWHVGGKQYRDWIFSSTEAAGRQFSYFLSSFPGEFVYIGGILALAGLLFLWRQDRRLSVFSMLLFAGCVLYSINYDIHDIDSYFLLAYFTTALWAGYGLFFLAEKFSRPRWVRWAIAGATVLILLVGNISRVSERQDYLVEDYTENMFGSLEPGALVLSYQWDNWVAAAYYKQFVKGERKDVTVVDKELLRRSWYLQQLEGQAPALFEKSRSEIDPFLREVDKFEHDRPYNPVVIEGRYAAMIRSFIEKGLPERPVYVTQEVEMPYTAGFQRVPAGLALRLYADTLFHPVPMPAFAYRPPARMGRLEEQTLRLYAEALVMRGDYYLARRGDKREAHRSYQAALQFRPADVLIMRKLAATGNDIGR